MALLRTYEYPRITPNHLKPYTALLRDKRRPSGTASSVAEWLAVIQGIYYIAGGLWPLISIRSFLAFTGLKTDLWLVQLLAALGVVIGSVFLVAAVRSVLSLELGLLLIGFTQR